MSFEKKEWKYKDTITADELNRMEDGIEEALDKGYSCTEARVTLTDESVTTTKAAESDPFAYTDLAYAELITADTIRVTFNGTEYVCENISSDEDASAYGAPFNEKTQSYDWSEYPFSISSYSDDSVTTNGVVTETAGTYQVKIEADNLSVTTTPCFEKAVKSVSGSSSKFVVTFTQDGSTYTADHTYAEVLAAYNSGKVVEGAYKINAEGETITQVCALASIENTNAVFTGVFNVYQDTSGAKINVFKFELDDNNTVEYTDAVIPSSN